MAAKTHRVPSREESLDRALAESFPASDPVSTGNPVTGTKATAPADAASGDMLLQQRIRKRAEKLWRKAGGPTGGADAFMDEARMLIAIEDDPKAGTLPNPATRPAPTGPEGEPVEPAAEVENEGEFPTLTDQGEQT